MSILDSRETCPNGDIWIKGDVNYVEYNGV